YLLDTNLEENHPEDRALLNKLYAGGPDLRLRQEWILGVGGVRVLRAVGVDPGVWHANEGHASFMMIERVRELVKAGIPFADALKQIRATTVFTTHTPVPAGHDAFDLQHLVDCTGPVWEELGVDKDTFLRLGHDVARDPGRFQMTVLALTLAGRVNGVSERHGHVSQEIWKDLWPGRPPKKVPIGSVTNGVHLATWMANPIMDLLDRDIGADWGNRLDDPSMWVQLRQLDPGAFWSVHQQLKGVMMGFVREDARRRFAKEWTAANQVVAAGTLLHPFALTIGFARRFATYKRANLIFRDTERLHRLLCDKRRPVQIVFAGKAHPADNPGKEVLQEVYQFTHDRFFEGRVAFLEDYDMNLASAMVQGCDMWLNLPRVPYEASGTSGMKAALNGVPQLSTIDGWWEEGYDGTNGWAIPVAESRDQEEADAADAENFYRLLEDEIIPLYYDRDPRGVPVGWVEKMRGAIRVGMAKFTGRRMVQEYAERYYIPAMRRDPLPDDPPTV
ncbi:MAG: alpha-glucan family phosphorylase, partial [Gemmatimonadota bacterium]